jgi:hypothetical protein
MEEKFLYLIVMEVEEHGTSTSWVAEGLMVDGIIWPEHVKKREVIWHGKKLLIPL